MLKVRDTTPLAVEFVSDGIIPNSSLPLILFEQSIAFTNRKTIEAELDDLAATNGWYRDWTGGVYKFTHWHSSAHEMLACIQGEALIQFGGPRVGCLVRVGKDDVVFIPAGVAHRKIEEVGMFTVCGLYPRGQKWDLIKGMNHMDRTAARRARRLPAPVTHPLTGKMMAELF